MRRASGIKWYTCKVADKSLEHFLFHDFYHERQLVEDNLIVFSIALETSCKPVKSKFDKAYYSNINDGTYFSSSRQKFRALNIL